MGDWNQDEDIVIEESNSNEMQFNKSAEKVAPKKRSVSKSRF